eukprot:COSAG06_NODE_1035_length_10999_cov_25.325229_8_plen_76_part_00
MLSLVAASWKEYSDTVGPPEPEPEPVLAKPPEPVLRACLEPVLAIFFYFDEKLPRQAQDDAQKPSHSFVLKRPAR